MLQDKVFCLRSYCALLFFYQTCAKLRKMDQKCPNSDFQSQNSMSNTDLHDLKIILYLEYWIIRAYFIIAMIWLIHFWKTLFAEKFLSAHMQPKISLFKKLFFDINFLAKNEHSLGWAHLCSTSVVILNADQ